VKQRWVRFWFWLQVSVGAINGLVALGYASDGRWGRVAFNGGCVALSAWCARVMWKQLERNSHGSDRRTEAGGGNSDAVGAPRLTLHSGGIVPGGGTYTFTVGATGANPGHSLKPGADKAPEIPVEQEDMPILAHRAAKLVTAVGGPRFGALHKKTNFGVDSVATCRAYTDFDLSAAWSTVFGGVTPPPRHEAPAVGCTCGWYAIPTDVPHDYAEDPHVDLLVELSGRVIEHEKGYRAQHQRVIECRVPPCELCAGETHAVRFVGEWSTRCSQHLPAEPTDYVNLPDLAKALGVPVNVAERTAS
jgi:hypothetical protein